LTNDRIEKLRKTMQEMNLDSFLMNSKANRFYMTGFTGTYGQAIISQTGKYIIADGRYFEQLKTQSPDFEVVDNKMRMEPTINELMKKENLKHLGIEAIEMNVEEYLALNSGDVNLVPTTNVIEKQRMIKDEDERQKIQKAGQISDETFVHILDYIKPGMTEKQVANEIDQYGLNHGADATAFETIVASGVRSALPHGHASNKVIQNNEMIIFDFGFMVDRYYSDITRTICLGKVDPQLKEIYQVTLDAQKKAISNCRDGVPMKNIDAIARDYITEKGYGKEFLHGTGHGLGLTVHEYPLFNADSEENLQNNMTFTVEPGIYLAGKGGVRIEDDVWINNDGEPELMTHSPKEWIEL